VFISENFLILDIFICGAGENCVILNQILSQKSIFGERIIILFGNYYYACRSGVAGLLSFW